MIRESILENRKTIETVTIAWMIGLMIAYLIQTKSFWTPVWEVEFAAEYLLLMGPALIMYITCQVLGLVRYHKTHLFTISSK